MGNGVYIPIMGLSNRSSKENSPWKGFPFWWGKRLSPTFGGTPPYTGSNGIGGSGECGNLLGPRGFNREGGAHTGEKRPGHNIKTPLGNRRDPGSWTKRR